MNVDSDFDYTLQGRQVVELVLAEQRPEPVAVRLRVGGRPRSRLLLAPRLLLLRLQRVEPVARLLLLQGTLLAGGGGGGGGASLASFAVNERESVDIVQS